ncbi:MAG: DUF418 domain-containing protein [Pseudonocardiaceae bacterium]
MPEGDAAEVSPVGATAVSARSLAPDLARGMMLLLIALANVTSYLYGDGSYGRGVWIRDYPVLDQTVLLLQATFVRDRVYPMFALLFGYGIVQLLRRQISNGVDAVTVRKLVRRRGWWLVLFGFLHALLLFSGDIIGAYGLLAVLLAGVIVHARDRTLLIMAALWTAALWTVPVALSQLLDGRLTHPETKANSISDPLQAAGIRVLEWAQSSTVDSIFVLVPALMVGVWAARRKLLDEPARYRPLLLRVAVLGVVLAVVGGIPWGLKRIPWWTPSSDTVIILLDWAHTLTGYAGGIGYAAIAGLITIRVQARGRPGWVVTALAACGQRSMTCYLLQSVVFVAVLAAYGGGLGSRLGFTEVEILAVVTWGSTVLLADAMGRRGYRGPAERLLRRLTYGPPAAVPADRS